VRHFALIGFVIVTGQMKEAVKHQDAQFSGETVTLFGGLAGGGFDGDDEVAGDYVLGSELLLGRGKRQDVGRFVLLAEAPVKGADAGIRS
jgi:hypothetical protein